MIMSHYNKLTQRKKRPVYLRHTPTYIQTGFQLLIEVTPLLISQK